jgi:hypothetical protein
MIPDKKEEKNRIINRKRNYNKRDKGSIRNTRKST